MWLYGVFIFIFIESIKERKMKKCVCHLSFDLKKRAVTAELIGFPNPVLKFGSLGWHVEISASVGFNQGCRMHSLEPISLLWFDCWCRFILAHECDESWKSGMIFGKPILLLRFEFWVLVTCLNLFQKVTSLILTLFQKVTTLVLMASPP